MTKNVSKEVIAKRKKLDETALQLKKEFVGIDSVIDEIIDSISPWYIFPNIQTKPCLVCAWGLTGVGKTALIRRIAELINFKDRHYEYDFGKSRVGSMNIESSIVSLFENEGSDPVIFTFDEFQFGRSVNEMGHELDRSTLSFIWEFIDTGKITLSKSFHSYSNLTSLKLLLKQVLREGVEVRNGIVIKGQKLYQYALDRSIYHTELRFIPRRAIDDLYEMLRETKSSELQVDRELLQLNGEQSIEYIDRALKMSHSPKFIDLSKSLIFILGNLDEAYTMSNDFTGDADADQFHLKSLEIGLPTIKKALRKRFRMEQIARLGHCHVIYPAFSKESFEKIIELKVNEYLNRFSKEFEITIKADSSLLKMIYRDGVFPTQGVRPILSCIELNIIAKMSTIFSKYYLSGKMAESLTLESYNETLIAKFKLKKRVVFREEINLNQKVQNLKKNNKDDQQALIAVHESGHAVSSMVLLNVCPEEIFSNSMDTDRIGFTYSKFNFNVLPKKLMINRVAFYLSGIVAEEIIFGKECITAGSSSDIEEATGFVTEMIRTCGMGKLTANIQIESYRTANYIHDDINEEVKVWLEEGKNIAKATLIEYKPLLLDIANYLSDQRTIKRNDILKIVENLYPEIHRKITKHTTYYNYREILKGIGESDEKRTNILMNPKEFELDMRINGQ